MTKTDKSQSGSMIILPMLFLGGMISYMDRAVIGVLAPPIREELGLTATEIGMASSIFAFGYGAFAFAGGWAADRFGAKRTLAVSMVAWSILCGMTGLAVGLMSLLLLRLIFGIFESPWVPSVNRMISETVPAERFSFAFSISAAGQPLGGAVAGPIAGLAAATLGWRLSFVVVAAIGLAWAIAWMLIVRVPDTAKPLKEVNAEPEEHRGSVRDMLTNQVFIATCISFGVATYVMTFFLAWFPLFLTDVYGLNQIDIGLASTIPWALGAGGILAGGFVADLLRRKLGPGLLSRRIMLGGCLIPAAISVVLVPFTPGWAVATGLMALAIGLLGMASPVYFATVTEIARADLVARAASGLVFCSTISGIVSPTISGYLIQTSGTYYSSFAVAGGLLMVGALIFIVAARIGDRTSPSV